MLSVVFPTYNESKNLPAIVARVEEALRGTQFEIIIVDDNSPDGTWKVAREISLTFPSLRVIRRVGRRGLSSAVIEGFLAARGDIFVVADADGQHDLSLIPKLGKAVAEGNGIALGSRYTEGGSVEGWDERRHLMSRIATRMAMSLCKVKVSDPMSGFFAVSRSAFEEILPRLNPKGFKILLDLLVHAPAGMTAKEIPFTFGSRMHGESKLSRRVQIEFLEYLYEATMGRFIPLTLVEYCVVGAMGVVVNLAAYFAVSRMLLGEGAAGVTGVSIPVVAGIEAAVLFNFYVNNSWTFSHAKLKGLNAITGFARYNVICALGAFANIAITTYVYSQGMTEVASLAAGACAGMIWNYTISLLFTWKAA